MSDADVEVVGVASPATAPAVKTSEVEKVEIGLATLYRGDCLAVTETLGQFDHTITDPPYEAEAHKNDRRIGTMKEQGKLEVRKLSFDAMDEITRSKITKLVVEKTNKWIMFFCQVEANYYWHKTIEEANAKYFTTMAWVKPDARPNLYGHGPGVGFENIVVGWCGEGRSSWNGGGKNGVFIHNIQNNRRDEFNTHLTIKPTSLMSELVLLFSNRDEVIFDPFMGSGSTGVACVENGRKFIGIEKNPEYFDICCRRIEYAQRSDIVSDSVYVKTKTKITVPLLDVPEKRLVAPPKPRGQVKKVGRQGKLTGNGARPQITVETGSGTRASINVPVKRFSVPTITVEKAPNRAEKVKIPFVDSFKEACRAVLAEAAGRPMVFDQWIDHQKDILGLDVECYRNFFLICFRSFKDGKKYVFERSTRTDFSNKFVEKIMKENRVITFNGMTYDIPMIYLALSGKSTLELKHASDKIIKGRMNYWEAERELKVSIPLIDHIDLKEPSPAIKTGLKIIGARLHGRFVVDLPFEESASLDGDQMNYTTLYCFNDIDETERLYNTISEALELRRNLSNEYKLDLRSKSDAQVGEAIVKKRIGGRLSKPPNVTSFHYKIPEFIKFDGMAMREVLVKLAGTEFRLDGYGKAETPEWMQDLKISYGRSVYAMGIGGLHSTEEHRAVHSDEDSVLMDADVSSQYPSIILKVGLYPEAAGPKFLEVYGAIVKERLEAKKEQQRCEREIKELEKTLREIEGG